ncbi:MAG TPA: PaaI family thioesterase [Candidatus Cybelea sp.]|nr:PaaI family thioesterase [Candidatus Cybelea sp.]
MPVMSKADLYRFLEEHFPQIAPLGMQIEHVGKGTIQVRVPVQDAHLRPGGTVSGPTLMTLADASTYLMILAQIGPVAMAVTTNLNITFLRKPLARDVIAKGELLRLGRRLAVADVRIYSEGEAEPVAQATLTYSIPPQHGED